MSSNRTIIAVLLGVIALSATTAQAAEATTKASDDSSVEVREWVVFITDPNRRTNARGDWVSSLPPFMDSRRATADETSKNRATPIGVIRFSGKTDPKLPIDVTLTIDGEAEAHWPKAQIKPKRLLWTNLVLDDATPELRPIESAHWMAGLRKAESAMVHSDRQVERFLLYDVETKYTPTLSLTRNGETVIAANISTQPLHDLTVYKKRADGWSQAQIELFAPSQAASATTRPAKLAPAAAFDAEVPKTAATTTAPATAPTTNIAGNSTTQPGTQPAEPPGTSLTFAPTGLDDDKALLEPWRARLEAAGVMSQDVDVVLNILRTNALDSRWMTAVYLLDPAELERMLPIEIVPQPRKITRVGLVILRNADPAIADDIDKLIQQCGDADYDKREEATAKLISLGQAAKPKVEQAVKDKDVEISQRAETILAALSKTTGR